MFYFSIQLGMSSSQLTNSYFFQRGRAQPPTRNHVFVFQDVCTLDFPDKHLRRSQVSGDPQDRLRWWNFVRLKIMQPLVHERTVLLLEIASTSLLCMEKNMLFSSSLCQFTRGYTQIGGLIIIVLYCAQKDPLRMTTMIGSNPCLKQSACDRSVFFCLCLKGLAASGPV